jgi:hypothetical protein
MSFAKEKKENGKKRQSNPTKEKCKRRKNFVKRERKEKIVSQKKKYKRGMRVPNGVLRKTNVRKDKKEVRWKRGQKESSKRKM